jgi:hypothetical protein
MQPLLQATPAVHNLITQACNLVDTTFLADFTQMQSTTTPQRHTQKQLAVATRAAALAQLVPQLTDTQLATLRSAGGPGAGDWLLTPTEHLVPLANDQFRVATRLRIALPQRDNKHTCPNICHRTTERGTCNTLMEDTLTHLLICEKGNLVTRRHDAMRDCWQALIATSVGTTPLAEQLVPTVARAPNGSTEHTRRADLVIPTAGAPTYLDIVVPSPLAPSWMLRLHTPQVNGAAAANAERYKHANYHPTPVVPLATEALGRHGQEALTFLQTLRHTAANRGTSFNTAHALQALALTLQRANADNIIAHLTPNNHIRHHQHINPPATITMAEAADAAATTPVPTTPRAA